MNEEYNNPVDLWQEEQNFFSSTIYYDVGDGFNEEQKVHARLLPGERGTVVFQLPEYTSIVSLRWEPIRYKGFHCAGVSLDNGDEVILPDSNSAVIHRNGVDYFAGEYSWYFFPVEKLMHSIVNIHYTLWVDYSSAKESTMAEKYSGTEPIDQGCRENLKILLEERNEQQKRWEQGQSRLLNLEKMYMEKQEELEELRSKYEQMVWRAKNDYYDDISIVATNNVEKTHRLDALDQELTAKSAALDKALADKEEHIAQLNASLNSLTNSRFWKMTWPLRYLTSGLRAKLRGGSTSPIAVAVEQTAAQKEDMAEDRLLLTPILEEEETLQSADVSVSFIVPVYNGGADLARLLSYLRAQEGLGKFEIIVVDSESTDESVVIAEYLGAKVVAITQEEFTHSYARNIGAKAAEGEYLCFMTQDAVPTGRWWARRMLEPLLDNRASAATCMEAPRSDASLYYRVGIWNHLCFMGVENQDKLGVNPAVQNHITLRQNAQLSDVACFIPAEVFLKYRYRGEYAEDLDLGCRLIRSGHRLAFISSERVIHSHKRSPYYNMRRAYVDAKWLHKILPETPLAENTKAELVMGIIQGYRHVKTLHEMLFRGTRETVPIDKFILQMETNLHVLGLLESVYRNSSPVPLSGDPLFDKVLSRLWELSRGMGRGRDGMVYSLIRYGKELLIPFMQKNYTKVTAEDRKEVADCFMSYFAVVVGDVLNSYVIQEKEPDEIHKLVTDFEAGI